jgi:hypothetical protein
MNLLLKKVIVIGVMACVFILLLAAKCIGGAWTMGTGELYERLSFNYYYADTEFSGNQDHLRKFIDMNVGNYIEYGLTDNITLINALYYKFLKKEDQSGDVSSNGLGDIDLGVKGKIAEGSWGVLSAQGLVKIPGLYHESDPLPLGNGQYDFELRTLYGRSLWPLIPGYCNFEIGYRWRAGAPSDEFRYLIEFGSDFTKYIYGRIKLDSILSMENGSKYNNSGNPMASNNFDLGKLDIALGFRITNVWGLEICYRPDIYGSNTTEGAAYTLALIYHIK